MKLGLATFAIATALGLAAAAADQPLRSEVVVERDIVTLGDFYPDAGKLAAIPLFRAPDLGTSGRVPASAVADRARRAGYEAAGTDGLRSVQVTRRAVVVDQARLETFLREELILANPRLKPENIELSLYGFGRIINADPAARQPISVERLDWQAETGRLEATVRIATNEPINTFELRGQAVEQIEIYTASVSLERGAVVEEEDLSAMKLPRHRVTDRMVTDPAAIIGLAARRGLRPGAPLQLADFEPPILVERGEKVTIVLQTSGMKLTAVAQALANGAKGQTIDVLNPQSRRTISATVTGRGQVTVNAGLQRTASLKETN
ncbi:flagellar basal body P-ring formation protein FlgA [Stappia sp. F7233]|uniref:Flagellar basal body P-ring formation protein FlgA n=1 Tax=Stappia albiluteola TaxID=2758565 RepID=A0A839AHW5_9HYPH|nr:flagellar basal body P-ring formation chaperone FlgA [Stappia albiluteola]MBA5779303.1 flagellar basal body P-ring formation protein FlgA [Stappia albiluteola]